MSKNWTFQKNYWSGTQLHLWIWSLLYINAILLVPQRISPLWWCFSWPMSGFSCLLTTNCWLLIADWPSLDSEYFSRCWPAFADLPLLTWEADFTQLCTCSVLYRKLHCVMHQSMRNASYKKPHHTNWTVSYSWLLHWSAVQCSAVQCSAVHCSTVQYSAVQCCAVHCPATRRSWPGHAASGGRRHGSCAVQCAVQCSVKYAFQCVVCSI